MLAGCSTSQLVSGTPNFHRSVIAKSSPVRQSELQKQQDEKWAKRVAAWAPVENAMNKGDVKATEAALALYRSMGYRRDDVEQFKLAKFFAGHGANDQARRELDSVVHRDVREAPSGYDPRACILWLDLNKTESTQMRKRVVDTWATGYRKQYGGPKELEPEASLEFEAAQYYMASYKDWKLGAEHYKKALQLAPNSRLVQLQTIWALRSTKQGAEAKRIALNAAVSADPKMQTWLYLQAGIYDRRPTVVSARP
jgi:hypothetical protein